ncbi:MAG: GNAT family N-acetyltransferase [Thermoplasmata archaeon]|nr:GNAT family N-acetyltransferase [Thermoplasmata archaeon]
MGSSPLLGNSVQLRPLRLSDAPGLDVVLRDPLATQMLPPRVRKERGIHFVTRVLNEQRTDGGVSFAILPAGSRAVVGQIRLFNLSPLERRVEVGYWIRRVDWGRGFGTEALRLACGYGFRVMSLHRIGATVVVGNDRSRKVLEHVGFRLEGRARGGARLAHRWADVWMFGLLRGELRPG